MKKITITFFALSRATDLEIKSETSIDNIVNDLFMVFAREIDHINRSMKIDCLQSNTTELKSKVNSVIQKYKDKIPVIQQLNNYFKDLQENEYFLVLTKEITQEQHFELSNYLLSLKNNENFEDLSKNMNDLYGQLRLSYEIFAFNESTKKRIGEADKSKRVCRFCKKTSDEVTFKKVAHSISEALGNKKIITNDECDNCNEFFGSSIEIDLISYLNLFRNIFGIKGKNGIPKLKGKNFDIQNNGVIEIKHYLTDEETNDPNRDDSKARLETTHDIKLQNIYKTLVKYALSVIDKDHISNFQNTIEWLKGENYEGILPKVAILESYDFFSKHPQIVVYLRKIDDYKLPYAIAEFRFTFLTFVYIIPMSSKDTLSFINKNEYDEFWNFFKHYNLVPNWKFSDLNNNVAKKFIMNLDFKPTKK